MSIDSLPGEITQSYDLETFTTSSRSSFGETVSRTTTDTKQAASVSAEAGVSYGPVSASVSSSYEWSKEVNDMLEKTTRMSSEDRVETKQVFKRECERLHFYYANDALIDDLHPGARQDRSAQQAQPLSTMLRWPRNEGSV
jgi:hypothetical protein